MRENSKDATKNLWDAAFDFNRVVAPLLAEWLPPGDYIPVEQDSSRAGRAVDVVGGVDGWYVTDETKLQGIAHRVQYGAAFSSFTVRSRLPSGNPTELQKRLEALERQEEHFVVPHFTVQAYVDRRRTGRLLMALMVRTADLFRFLLDHLDMAEERTNPEDGAKFLVVWASDLQAAGLEVRTWLDEELRDHVRGRQATVSSSDEWEEVEEQQESVVVGRTRLRMAALKLAVNLYAAELKVHPPRPQGEGLPGVEEVISKAEEILRSFEREGFTELPPADCDYCDPHGADLFPDWICPACGRLPEER